MTKPAKITTDIARRIDEIASGAVGFFQSPEGFEAELTVARAVRDLREALTPEVMAPVMALMNTDLGFRTDKDPAMMDKKTGKPHVPYGMETVRECFIESKLRGFHTVGNEWNIISGRFYATRNGLERKAKSYLGMSDLKLDVGVPKATDTGTIVHVRATWKWKGKDDFLDAEIPVKVNEYMGADAIIGKAQRKAYKRILDRITGTNTPEGEAGEEVNVQATVVRESKLIKEPTKESEMSMEDLIK